MNTNLNSYTLQITGLSELEKPLEIEQSYDLQITAECVSITKTTNDDGSFSFRHKLRQSTANIQKENGEIIKVKDTKKQSQKLRSQLVAIALDRGIDPETFYQETMTDFRHYTLEILDFLKGIKNV